MRDDDHDPAARPHAENGAGERLLAFGIEIGVGLVEHDQERLAVERARERDPLPLSGGQRRAALAEFGLVAGGQADDQVVHAGGLGRGDHGRLGRIIGSNRAMFCATVPSNSSTSCGRYPMWRPRAAGVH